MVAAYSGGKNYNEADIQKLIQNHQIGGLIFMQGTPEAQATQTNKFQQMAQVPLLLAMDAEWGLGMRLSGVRDFPRQMMLGATQDSATAYRVGAAIAAQCNRMGVHVDFAPVVDVNNNPNNPVINARSFGEDKRMVALLGTAYMKGLQDNGVMACAKHFPGHGDTDADSHKDLPVIRKSYVQLDSLEFFPFKRLIKEGVQSAMVAHLEVPSLETGTHIPTTLSKNTVTQILRKKLGFTGLIFTDALNMQGVAKYFEPGDVDLRAFEAGNDVLLFSQNVPVAIQKIKAAMQAGSVSEARLAESVKKILAAKWDAGLNKYTAVNPANATADLNTLITPIREATIRRAITLVRDKNGLLNKIKGGDSRVGYVGINAKESTLLDRLHDAKSNISFDWLPKGSAASSLARIKEAISNTDVTIVAIHNLSFYPSGGDYGLDNVQMQLLKDLQAKDNVFFVDLGNAYLLKNFCKASGIMVAYEDDEIIETAVAKALLKDSPAPGSLPVTPCDGMTAEPEIITPPINIAQPQIPANTGVYTLKKYDFTQDAGVTNPDALLNLSKFIQKSVAGGAFPGCRVLAAQNGKIFYDEAFGYYDYTKKKGVELFTMYDVASVTKILATTLAVMKLYETGKLSLDKTLGDYLKWTRGTNKGTIRIRDLLLHQAGLKSWIPFYKQTLDETGNLKDELYRKTLQKDFRIPVASQLYLRNDYPDSIWHTILESPLENRGRYVYSDLDFYFLAAVVEELTNKPLNEYVEVNFYKPLGLKRISYNPLQHGFKSTDIAPTENDVTFRRQMISGYVHDPGAALFGGVAGHAGIFASANDVAVIFQMLLNGGIYNGKRFFNKETVQYFSGYKSSISRRGLGFDKPSADADDGGPAGNRVSGFAFGHQGFTGTCAWADPETGIVFVFLSNRINPSADNSNINRLSVRTVAQDYLYEAVGVKENKARREVYKSQTRFGIK